MPSMDARQPPRFVPTLTDVVLADQLEQREQLQEDLAPAPVHSASEIEAFDEDKMPEPALVASSPVGDVEPDRALLAQTVQASIMERLDSVLEERLRYALADMVQLHTQAMYQAIRQDVERLVSASVHEAIAQELANLQKSQPS